MNILTIVRFILSLLVGGGVFGVSAAVTDGESTFEVNEQLAINFEWIWGIAAAIVTQYFPDGWLKRIALLVIDALDGDDDGPDPQPDDDDRGGDLLDFIRDLFDRLVKRGAPPEELELVKKLAEAETRKAFRMPNAKQ